ncbi:MAG: hypothetical protein ABSD28_17150 [Tepidisphaeraceae bacterium]|jgi:hypothetical protein
MGIRYFIFGAASSIAVLLIVGGIFAIRAHANGEDAGGVVAAPAAPPAAAQVPPAPQAPSAPSNPFAAVPPSRANPTPAGGIMPPAQPPRQFQPTGVGDVDPASIGYTVLANVDSGRTIFAQKTDATTPRDAIIAALRDMTRILDSKPTALGAFADAQQQRRGGATFGGLLRGQPVKGIIMCGIGDKGAAITIIYARADAPNADWAKLTAALPLDLQMQTQTFGDGAGTIGVPPHWKITSASNIGSVFLEGPAQQTVGLGIDLEIATPDSMFASTQNQLIASGQLPPAMRMLIAPYTGPTEALKNLTPQLSLLSQARGGPAIRLDQILQSSPMQPQFPNGQAARLYYRTTQSHNGQSTGFRAWAQLECYPVGNGIWGVFACSVSGPDATFDTNLPIMLDISKSWKLNDAVIAQHSQQNIAASNARFQAFEQSQKEKQDAFDDYLASVQHNELIRERSNADFDEVIIGYRTVYDTETGEHRSVDLGNVDGIVNALNEGDPGRYVQIPLRDEEFPLP